MLPYREPDDAVGLTEIAGNVVTDNCRVKNGRYGLAGQFRQSVFGRLGGHDDVNKATSGTPPWARQAVKTDKKQLD